MSQNKFHIGVCSWSLQTGPDDVAAVMKGFGVNHVHLGIGPALEDNGQAYLNAIKRQDWTISCTMIGFAQEDYTTLDTIKATGGILPDDCWAANKRLYENAVTLTQDLKVPYLSMHVGFIDPEDQVKYQVMCERIIGLANFAQENGIMLLMETGQETAQELKAFLEHINHAALGINYDPANMILYGKGDPVHSIETLAPWIKHVHIKDGIKADTAGQWGTEVPWGDGQVGASAFLAALEKIGYSGTLAIEREGGEQRKQDIGLAVQRLKAALK